MPQGLTKSGSAITPRSEISASSSRLFYTPRPRSIGACARMLERALSSLPRAEAREGNVMTLGGNPPTKNLTALRLSIVRRCLARDGTLNNSDLTCRGRSAP